MLTQYRLSGLMVWSSDLDDNNFTALSALTGKEISGSVLDPNDGKSVQQDWAGQNGQQCRKNDECSAVNRLDVSKCNANEQMVGWDKAGCNNHGGESYGKAMCCPVNARPRKCTWRGSGGDCNGQCHKGTIVPACPWSSAINWRQVKSLCFHHLGVVSRQRKVQAVTGTRSAAAEAKSFVAFRTTGTI